MISLREKFNDLNYWHPVIKKKFMVLLVEDLVQLDRDDGLKTDRTDFLQELLPVYFRVVNQQFDATGEIEKLFGKYCRKSPATGEWLAALFENLFAKLEKLAINFDNELDIEPVERFLLIRDKIPFSFPRDQAFLQRERYEKYSDREFENIRQEFNLLLREKGNKNLLSVGIERSYANIPLPKSYEIIFDAGDLKRYWQQKTIVKYAFNYKTYFHTDLWRGHHSHCLLEVIGELPGIFDELPVNGDGRPLHKGIGLCTQYDWQYIKSKSL